MVLSTELITEIGKAKVGIVGFVCVYKQKIELRYCWEHGNEKDKNKFVEWKAFVDTEGIKRANLKDKFLFWRFAAIQTALMMGKAATQTSISYLEWLGRLKVSSDWFGCVLIKEMTKGSKRQLRNSLRWSIYVINSVYDTKLPCLFYLRLFYVVTWIWSVDTCKFVLWLRHWGESKPFTYIYKLYTQKLLKTIS